MPLVRFTPNLKRFYPQLKPTEIEGDTVADLVRNLEQHYPGLAAYIVDEIGQLREHVNIFVGNEMVEDEEKLSDKVGPTDEIYILQALSGG